MSIHRVLSQDQDIHRKWAVRFATVGRTSLDDVLEDLYVRKEKVTEIDERTKKIYDTVNEIVKKYLNSRERLIFYLYIEYGKNIAEIKKICNFGCWFTSQAHIIRMFKLVKLYYKYETMDKSNLESIIEKNFTKNEMKIINLLHGRYSFPEISKEIKCYYRKTYYDCKDILDRLQKLCPDYYNFITDLRKFKRLNDFDIQITDVEI